MAAVARIQALAPKTLAQTKGDISGVYLACDTDDVDASVGYYKVQESQNGHFYAKKYDGEWVYEGRRPLYFIYPDDKVTAEEAARFGHAHGCCLFCLRNLTDERSTEVGYGPVCAEKNGLPWG